MRLFNCPSCNHVLYFENTSCYNCKSEVAYSSSLSQFLMSNEIHVSCSNRQVINCNWIATQDNGLCSSCALTNHIPIESDYGFYGKLKLLEASKRRLIYQLNQLNLPIKNKQLKSGSGLEFDFLKQNNDFGALTGHDDGTITVILSEADSVYREQIRKQMSEPYRTLLGHFRHEVGHYYWDILFQNQNLEDYRYIFGDETQDYATSLETYYENGAPNDWQENYISKYASSHPWEDWAETWAHYLHLTDIVETAFYSGVSIHPKLKNSETFGLSNCPNPYTEKHFKPIYDAGISLTNSINSLNRAMGIPDIYPFVIPKSVYNKLEFIHKILYNIT